MAAHRYWRIRGLPQSGGHLAFSEVQLRGVIGGPDLTTGLGANAYASSFHDANYLPSFVVDDNTATRWACTFNALPAWWAMDFGAGNEKDIVEIVITSREASLEQSPKEFTVDWSDDNVNWTTLAGKAEIPGWTALQSRTYDLYDPNTTVYSQQLVMVTAANEDRDIVSAVQLATVVTQRETEILAFSAHMVVVVDNPVPLPINPGRTRGFMNFNPT